MPSEFARITASPHEPGVYYVDRDTWQVGTRYELRKVLGTGSFSAVCLAWDRVEGEKVALKRVGDVFASLDYAKRVLREVCIMRRLEHPNIIRLKDVFLKPSPTGKYVFRGGRLVPTSYDCYMAMECCEQGDLFNMRGQLPEHEVRSLLWQLLGALRYLHGLNVWHRDIKTGNILLTLAEGRRVLKVADFGSARSAKEGGEVCPQQDGGEPSTAPAPECQLLRLSSDGMDLDGETDAFAAAKKDPVWMEGADGDGAPPRSGGCSGRSPRTGNGAGGLAAAPAAEGGYQAPLTSLVCTPCYRAPEVVMSRGGYSSAIDMWSAGCVFGELLQRAAYLGKASTPHLQVAPVFAIGGKPLTPNTGEHYGARGGGGASAYAELSALFSVIGTPAWACIETVPSEAWRRYLFHIPGRAPTLHRRFNPAGEVAVDLLVRLLQFDPRRRASAEEAMAHEYFAMMHMEAQMEAAELAPPADAGVGVRAGRPIPAAGPAGAKTSTPRRSVSSGDADDEAAARLSTAEVAGPAPLPTWPPGRSTPQRGGGSGTRTASAEMEVGEEGAQVAARSAPQPMPRRPQAVVSAVAVPPARRTPGGASSAGGCSGTLLTKRKQVEDASEGEPADAAPQQQQGGEPVAGRKLGSPRQGAPQQQQQKAVAGSLFVAKPRPLSFWQLDEPALALAALEAELASLVTPDSAASGAGRVAPGGARAATAMETPEALAFVEECKERLRQMLERECDEHAARAAARRGAEHDTRGTLSSAGGSATGGSGSVGRMVGLGGFRRNNSDGLLTLYDGQLLGGAAGAAALHGHLRPDPGQQLDPSMIGYERIPYHGDAAAARLEPEKHLWAGRHGEWTESSLAAQPREASTGTWGVTLMPPGMDEGTAAGRACIDVMRSQQAR